MHKNSRGMGLATTLMVVSLGFLLAFVLAGTSMAHLGFSQRLANAQSAREAAESVAALAVERLMASAEYGLEGSAVQPPGDVLEVRENEALGRIVFLRSKAEELNLPLSLNNLAEDGSRSDGWNHQLVPGHSVHLVAHGESNGVVRIVEVLVNVPASPEGLTSSGPVNVTNGIVMATDVLDHVLETLDPEADWALPANIASNSDSDEGVNLGAGTVVTGDAMAQGKVKLDPAAELKGAAKNGTSKKKLPKIDILKMDPLEKAGVQNPGSTLTNPSLTGLNRTEGTTVITGDLNLKGLLYVSGDLIVKGDIQGTGGVYVEGSTTIQGAAEATRPRRLVVASQGPIIVQGNDRDKSSFQGTLYSESSISATDMTVRGMAIVNSADPEGGINLQNANSLHVPEYAKVNVSFETAGTSVGSATLKLPFSEDRDQPKHWEFGYEKMHGEIRQDIESPDSLVYVNVEKDGSNFKVQNPWTGEWSEPSTADGATQNMIKFFSKDPNDPHQWGYDPNGEDELKALATMILEDPEQIVDTGTTTEGDWAFDLNQLMPTSDQLKIVLWRLH